MKHAQLLRWSLFGSLGLMPVGCGGDSTGGKPTCSSPQANAESGLVNCEEGYAHRPVVVTCGEQAKAAPAVDQSSLPRVEGFVSCDADPTACDAFQYGYCSSGQGGPICASGCSTDQDCGDGLICLCNGAGWGVCEGSTCSTDADCETGLRCASYSIGCGGGYACQTARDTCAGAKDCAAHETCQPQADGHRACAGAAVCGRPFLVAARARVAPVVRRADWLLRPLT